MSFLVTTAKFGKGKRKYLLSRSETHPFNFIWTLSATKAKRYESFDYALAHAEIAYKAIVLIEDEGGLLFPIGRITIDARDLFVTENL